MEKSTCKFPHQKFKGNFSFQKWKQPPSSGVLGSFIINLIKHPQKFVAIVCQIIYSAHHLPNPSVQNCT